VLDVAGAAWAVDSLLGSRNTDDDKSNPRVLTVASR